MANAIEGHAIFFGIEMDVRDRGDRPTYQCRVLLLNAAGQKRSARTAANTS